MLTLDASGKRVFDPAKAGPVGMAVAKYVYPSDKPAEAVEKVKAASYYMDPQARLDVGDIYNQIAWLKSQGLVETSVDPKAFLDLSFVKGHMNAPK
jgi:hypothetical protein